MKKQTILLCAWLFLSIRREECNFVPYHVTSFLWFLVSTCTCTGDTTSCQVSQVLQPYCTSIVKKLLVPGGYITYGLQFESPPWALHYAPNWRMPLWTMASRNGSTFYIHISPTRHSIALFFYTICPSLSFFWDFILKVLSSTTSNFYTYKIKMRHIVARSMKITVKDLFKGT